MSLQFDRHRRSSLVASVIAVAFAVVSLPARADSNITPRTISVSGHGDVKAVPDEAELSAGVVSEAATANEAVASNRKAMNAVFAALKDQGIPDRSIQTSEFAISPQYDQGKNDNGPQRIISYRVSNTVSVTVTDLSKLGAVIDALAGSGSNAMGGIRFTVRDPKPLRKQARTEAVKDAMDRAETFAQASGVTLGRVTEISENGASVPRPLFRSMAVVNGLPSTPIAAGEETISADVSMTFEIK
jgi:uncharacterized protein YggE